MTTEPTNIAIDLAEEGLNIIKELLIEKAIKEMIEEVAWLAMPVVNPLFTFIVKFVGKFLYKKAALEAAFKIIEKQTGDQRDNYNHEMAQYKEAIKQGKSDAEIQKERDEAKERLRKLINLNAG